MERMPNLKVIQVLRDSRGIFISRQRSVCIDGGYGEAAKHLCNQMVKDIDDAEKLAQRHPSQIKTILYEDLAVTCAKKLYDFIGMRFKKFMEDYVYNITSAGLESNGVSSSRLHACRVQLEELYKTQRRPIDELLVRQSIQ